MSVLLCVFFLKICLFNTFLTRAQKQDKEYETASKRNRISNKSLPDNANWIAFFAADSQSLISILKFLIK